MRTLDDGTVKRIHVDRRILAQNLKTGRNDPAITVQTSKGSLKANNVHVYGNCHFVQAGIGGTKPLSCGARVWVETHAFVELYP